MMPARYRASLGYLVRHPWQLALAVLGGAIGVAVIVAVDLANASAKKAFLLSMDTVTGEATHQVVGGPQGVDEAIYRDLRVRHGLRSLAPIVEGEVRIGGENYSVLGVDLFAEQALRQFTRSASVDGREDVDARALFRDMLTLPGAVTMSRTTAERLIIETGQTIALSAGGRPRIGPGVVPREKTAGRFIVRPR